MLACKGWAHAPLSLNYRAPLTGRASPEDSILPGNFYWLTAGIIESFGAKHGLLGQVGLCFLSRAFHKLDTTQKWEPS
jgi:hypothetical protein